MTALQAWLIGGIPALALAAIAFVGRSPWRALAGYAILIAGFVVLASADRSSAALFGVLIALVYATGRGGRMESEPPAEPDWPRAVSTDA